MATCSGCGNTLGYDCDCNPLFICAKCDRNVFATEYNGQLSEINTPICPECAVPDTNIVVRPEVALDPDADAQELEKYRVACKQISSCGLRDFLDWLRERYVFATHLEDDDDRRAWGSDLAPVPFNGEQIFADYFEIDLNAVERARRRLLDSLADKASEAS